MGCPTEMLDFDALKLPVAEIPQFFQKIAVLGKLPHLLNLICPK